MENNGTWLSPGYGTWATIVEYVPNDMQYQVNESNLTMYADDHQLYATGKTHEAVDSDLISQGWQALAWYKNNFLLANPEKFQSLSINPRNIDVANSDRALYIDNQKIKKNEQLKLLGIYIDENLNFAGHISDLCTRTRQNVGVLVRLRNQIPCKAKLTLCKSAILPHLTYCHLVWNFCKSSSDSRKIKRVQERTLRAKYKSKTETHEELLARARLPTLYNRRLQDIATLNNLVPSCPSRLFKTKNSQYCPRNWVFEIPRFNTTSYGKLTIRYQGPYIWSKLSKELRMSMSTFAIFKTRVRKLDLSDLIHNNSSCCKLCKSWTESFYIIS